MNNNTNYPVINHAIRQIFSGNARKWLSCTMLASVLVASAGFTSVASAPENYQAAHDERGNLVRSTNGDCVRTRWLSSHGDECATAAPVVAPEPAVGAPLSYVETAQISIAARTVYFEFNKARLTETELAKLNSLTEVLKSRKDIRGVRIVGYADRIGKPSYNERLSRHRAEVVEKYLRDRGYLSSTLLEVRWFGAAVPSAKCSNKLSRSAMIACLEKDRRVEIEIDYIH